MNLFPFYIARRYLVARRKGVFVSLVFIISVGGLVLGVAATIITLSIMNGFQTDLRKKILGMSAHIVLLSRDQQPFPADPGLEKTILQTSGVTNISPFLYTQVVIRSRSKSAGVVLKGVDWDREAGVTSVKDYVKKGFFAEEAFSSRAGKKLPGIVMGYELARTLSVYTGDEVFIVTSENNTGAMEVIPKMTRCLVTGIFESGMYEYDSNLAYISLDNARRIFDSPGRVTGYSVRTGNEFLAEKTASRLQFAAGYDFQVKSWMKMNKNLFSALKLEKIMMFIILTLISIVASFNIASTLILLTVDKIRDIGILKAIGSTQSQIRNIFVFQGAFIGLFGVLLGQVLGIAISLLLKKYSIIDLPADVYYISKIPVMIQFPDLLLVGSVAFVISLLASVYPAVSASKLSPVEAIKNE